jgi:PST family polysaccharide transporter
MRYSVLVAMDIASTSAGITTGIVAAWKGMGYWSLVLMQLASAFVSLAAVWIACPWRPGMPVRRSGVRSMLAFGGNLTLFGVVNYFSRNLDNVLIGSYWGPQLLGLYSRAYSLLLLPIGQFVAPVTNVAAPALSRLQDEPDRFCSFYLKAVKMTAYATMSLVVVMFVLSDEIVGLFLGTQWLEAVPIFRILAVAAIVQPVCSTAGWIYTALSQTDRMLKWGCLATPITVLAFAAGLPFGPKGVAAFYAASVWGLVYPCFSIAAKRSPVSVPAVFANTWRPFVFSLLLGSGIFAVRSLASSLHPIWVIVISLTAGAFLFSVIGLLWKPVGSDLREIMEMRKSIFKAS